MNLIQKNQSCAPREKYACPKIHQNKVKFGKIVNTLSKPNEMLMTRLCWPKYKKIKSGHIDQHPSMVDAIIIYYQKRNIFTYFHG